MSVKKMTQENQWGLRPRKKLKTKKKISFSFGFQKSIFPPTCVKFVKMTIKMPPNGELVILSSFSH